MPENLVSDLLQRVHIAPDAVLLRRPAADGADERAWDEITATMFLGEVRAVAGGLRRLGIDSGERVMLFSQTTYDWTLLDYSIWYAGGVTVPVYPSSDDDALTTMISDCGPALAVADTEARADRLRSLAPELTVRVLEGDGLSELMSTPATFPPLVEADDAATVIYTPGTTGDPRGCVLSHRALLSSATALCEALDDVFTPSARTLVLLPLPHVFARELQVACIHAGVAFGHSRGLSHLEADLASIKPTFVLGVPRLFERLYTRASQQAAIDGRARTFDKATEIAIAFSQALDGGGPSLRLRSQHSFHNRFAYNEFRETLGGACRVALCGGAPLGDRLGHFFRGAGVPILEGYVLTETAGAVTLNRLKGLPIGSVGEPLRGVETRIDDEGELLVRGDHLFSGYWNNHEATADALRDGWFHTGDIAEPGSGASLTIIGRKREIIVTAGGKQIVPTVLEDRIREHPLIDQVVVVGDGQPFAAALVTIDPDGFAAWQQRTGKSGALEALTDDADLRGAVTVAVEQANRTVSPAEAVRRFAILPSRWTESAGQLTPSLKLRRDVVIRQHRTEIEALFGF